MARTVWAGVIACYNEAEFPSHRDDCVEFRGSGDKRLRITESQEISEEIEEFLMKSPEWMWEEPQSHFESGKWVRI